MGKSPWWVYGINQQKTNSTWSSNPILCFPAIIIVIYLMLFASTVFLLNHIFCHAASANCALCQWGLDHILLTNNHCHSILNMHLASIHSKYIYWVLAIGQALLSMLGIQQQKTQIKSLNLWSIRWREEMHTIYTYTNCANIYC